MNDREREFQMLVEFASDVLSRHTPDGTYTYASPSARQMLGYEPEELIGRNSYEFVHPDDLAVQVTHHEVVLNSGEVHTNTVRFRRKDGSYIWAENSLRNIIDPETDEVIGVVVISRDITARRDDEALLQRWEQCFLRTSRGMAITDPVSGLLQDVNPSFARMHGGEVSDFVGKPLEIVFTPDEAKRIPFLSEDVYEKGYIDYQSEHLRLDGSRFPVHTEVIAAKDDAGNVKYRIEWFNDLTELREVEGRRRRAQRDLETAFDDAPIGMAMVGLDGEWLKVNRALCILTGYSEDELRKLTFQDLTHPDDLDADLDLLNSTIAGEIDSYETEKRYFTKQNRLIWVLLSVSMVRDDDGSPSYFVSQLLDISERKRLEKSLYELADHDPLTGLWNRRRFEEELKRQVARCQRYGEHAALLMMDIDHLKDVNDSFGHRFGDRMLQTIAQAARRRLRGSDSLARLSGDEFAAILIDVSPDAAMRLAEDLVKLIGGITQIDGSDVASASASVGVAFLNSELTDDQDALVAADVALYEAKAQGRNRARAYNGESNSTNGAVGGLLWQRQLRQAMVNESFELHVQPIIDLASGDTAQYELLIRVRLEDGGLVYPNRFLHIAERLGYVRALDRWVIRQAAIQLVSLHPGAALAVNLSAHSLGDDDLPEYIETVLSEVGADPVRLVFELTETAAIANMKSAEELTRRIKRLGCRFALHDFGSGFASFACLKALPFDFLKIDEEFIRDLTSSDRTEALVSAMNNMAHLLGGQTIAEQIEDQATLEILNQCGTDFGQGYLFAAPAPIESVLAESGPVGSQVASGTRRPPPAV